MEARGSEFSHHADGTVIAFKPRRSKRRLQNEEICYECGCGGSVVECDECPKVFHLECIADLGVALSGRWQCPWHSCTSCGGETETAITAGYYCVHCPKSFCDLCASNTRYSENDSLRQFAFSSVPAAEIFSSLRRNGFTLQNPDSRLFVCQECVPNTDFAVSGCYLHINDKTSPKRKFPFKISSAIKYKKLLRSLNLSSLQKFGRNLDDEINVDKQTDDGVSYKSGNLKIDSTEPTFDSSYQSEHSSDTTLRIDNILETSSISIELLDQKARNFFLLTSNYHLKKSGDNGIFGNLVQVPNNHSISIEMATRKKSIKIPLNSKYDDNPMTIATERRHEEILGNNDKLMKLNENENGISTKNIIFPKTSQVTEKSPKSKKYNISKNIPDYNDRSSFICDVIIKYPSIQNFFQLSAFSYLIKMRQKGWTFLFPFPLLFPLLNDIKDHLIKPSLHIHKLLGVRCRRYFNGYGKSDGILVAYLSGKRNDGLILLHCIHDDGDEEDLNEEEAFTAFNDFIYNVKTKHQSNKMKVAYKEKLELEMLTLRAQCDVSTKGASGLMSRAALMAEVYRRAPVECIGLQVPHVNNNGNNKNNNNNNTNYYYHYEIAFINVNLRITCN